MTNEFNAQFLDALIVYCALCMTECNEKVKNDRPTGQESNNQTPGGSKEVGQNLKSLFKKTIFGSISTALTRLNILLKKNVL